MAAGVAVAGPIVMSRGDVQAAAMWDGLIFAPLALVGGALGVLLATRRPPKDDRPASCR